MIEWTIKNQCDHTPVAVWYQNLPFFLSDSWLNLWCLHTNVILCYAPFALQIVLYLWSTLPKKAWCQSAKQPFPVEIFSIHLWGLHVWEWMKFSLPKQNVLFGGVSLKNVWFFFFKLFIFFWLTSIHTNKLTQQQDHLLWGCCLNYLSPSLWGCMCLYVCIMPSKWQIPEVQNIRIFFFAISGSNWHQGSWILVSSINIVPLVS